MVGVINASGTQHLVLGVQPCRKGVLVARVGATDLSGAPLLIPAELARCLEAHGLHETEASITSKLARGTFAATFLLAVLAALDLEELSLNSL